MNRLLMLSLATAVTAAGVAAPADAQRWNDRGWRTVGYKTVDGRDSDRINLPGRTRQTALRICAINQPLQLRDLDIRFANGRTQDAATRTILRAGQCTRAIDLRGNRRDIERVQIKYAPILRTWQRPVVRVQVR